MYNSEISFVAIENKKVIGVIRGNRGCIFNLFVDGVFHGKGIGKILVNVFERKAKDLGASEIKIRASLYAVPFYSSRGYKKTTGIKKMHEIKMQPMRKFLNG